MNKRLFNEKFSKLYNKYNREEINHFKYLPLSKQNEIFNIEQQIDDYKSFKEPLRFKFLSLKSILILA